MEVNNSMNSTPTTNATSGANSTTPVKAVNDKGVMGKDDFLKLFLASLQHQDPMSPMETKDMMAQMTQLATMEQQTNMSKIMEDLKEIMEQQEGIEKGVGFLGKEVSGLTTEGELVEGSVDEVVLNSERLQLVVNNKMLDLASVSRVADYSKYATTPKSDLGEKSANV